VIAWVFMEILMILKLNENKQMDETRAIVELEIPIQKSAIEANVKEKISGIRLSYLDTKKPETGSPIIELMGIHRRIVPNSASLYSKKVLMVGILEAQVEKQKPERKKKTLKNILCLFFNSINSKMRLQISVFLGYLA
jgi:hypothetical protein